MCRDGLRSSPGHSCTRAETQGPLRSPFATQGRSYRYSDNLKPCAVPVGAGVPAKRPVQAALGLRINPETVCTPGCRSHPSTGTPSHPAPTATPPSATQTSRAWIPSANSSLVRHTQNLVGAALCRDGLQSSPSHSCTSAETQGPLRGPSPASQLPPGPHQPQAMRRPCGSGRDLVK